MVDAASSYTTAAIALTILEALMPTHPNLLILRQFGYIIEGG